MSAARNGFRRKKERRQSAMPQRMGDVVSQLLARSGYGQTQLQQQYQDVWRSIVGTPYYEQSRVQSVRNGILYVAVGSSTMLQELSFRKRKLLSEFQKRFTEKTIQDLRFRVTQISENDSLKS